MSTTRLGMPPHRVDRAHRFRVALAVLALATTVAHAQDVERPGQSVLDRLFGLGTAGDVGRDIAAIDDALGKWDVEAAEAIARGLLGRHPGAPAALLAASRVRFYASDYEAATDFARRAAAGAERDASAAKDAAELVAWLEERAPTWRSFREHRRGLVLVRVTERDEILAPYALDALEGAQAAMAEELGFVPKSPVVVEFYPTRRSFIAASTLSREEVETSGTLAICHFNRLMVLSPGVLARGYDWMDALSHEYVHLAVYKVGGNTVPVWLHEGIAKTLESRWRLEEPEPLDPRLASVLAEGLDAGKWVTFEQMHPSMAKLPSAALVSMAFAEVATSVQMMRAERGASAARDIVLALREKDGVLDAALQAAWGLTLAGLEARTKAWAQAAGLPRVPGLAVFDEKHEAGPRGAGLEFQDEGETPADPEEEARRLEDRKAQDWTILGDRLKGRNFLEAAIIEYDKALARVGQGEPILVGKKALALILAGRPADARPILEESLRWNPGLSVTLDNLCEVHLRLAAAAKDPATADAEFRKALDAARQSERTNPFSVDTHLRLASLYERFGMAREAQLARERLALLRR